MILGNYSTSQSRPVIRVLQSWMLDAGIYVADDDFIVPSAYNDAAAPIIYPVTEAYVVPRGITFSPVQDEASPQNTYSIPIVQISLDGGSFLTPTVGTLYVFTSRIQVKLNGSFPIPNTLNYSIYQTFTIQAGGAADLTFTSGSIAGTMSIVNGGGMQFGGVPGINSDSQGTYIGNPLAVGAEGPYVVPYDAPTAWNDVLASPFTIPAGTSASGSFGSVAYSWMAGQEVTYDNMILQLNS